jgi:hypothetical protein
MMARVCFVAPLMLNDKGSKTQILRFRLLDNTGEISAVAYYTYAEVLANKLKVIHFTVFYWHLHSF